MTFTERLLAFSMPYSAGRLDACILDASEAEKLSPDHKKTSVKVGPFDFLLVSPV